MPTKEQSLRLKLPNRRLCCIKHSGLSTRLKRLPITSNLNLRLPSWKSSLKPRKKRQSKQTEELVNLPSKISSSRLKPSQKFKIFWISNPRAILCSNTTKSRRSQLYIPSPKTSWSSETYRQLYLYLARWEIKMVTTTVMCIELEGR